MAVAVSPPTANFLALSMKSRRSISPCTYLSNRFSSSCGYSLAFFRSISCPRLGQGYQKSASRSARFISLRAHQARQLLRSHQPVTATDQFGYFVPIHAWNVQPEGHPAAGPDVGRQVKLLRVRGDERVVVSRQHFAADGDDAVAM